MEHIGIDLGGKESQVCIRSSDGAIIGEVRKETDQLNAFVRSRPPSRVVMETCAEAFAIAEDVASAGYEVRVVPATLVRTLGVGERGIKTDVRDARKLSEVSCRIDLPSVHIPTRRSRDWKAMLGQRDQLVSTRRQLVNSIRGLLRTQLVRLRKGGATTFPDRVRQRLLERPEGLPEHVERQLRVIELLNQELKSANKELAKAVKADSRCLLLMTTPGVGPVTASRFVSTVDDISRFPNAHALESYLGLTPGERSSSARQNRTSITKAGASAVRACLTEASWVAWRLYPKDPLVSWARQVAERRGKQVAITALSRRLAGVLFAMWRDGRPYEPSAVRGGER